MKKRILSVLAAFMMFLIMGAASANAAPTEGVVYGWKWSQPVVYVYDATGYAEFKVPEAVAEWSRPSDSLVLQMTSDPALADITIVPYNDMNYAGYARWSVVNGVAESCTIQLQSTLYPREAIMEYVTVHELGHCLGIAHNTTDQKSVMNETVDMYPKPNAAPTAFDYKTLRRIYG